MRKYIYKVHSYRDLPLIQIEAEMNYLARDGRRVVAVDFSPRLITIISETEVKSETE